MSRNLYVYIAGKELSSAVNQRGLREVGASTFITSDADTIHAGRDSRAGSEGEVVRVASQCS